ncbi:MAG: KamA family radical SAM protein [Lentisphaerae bacterium]|nr:KamA family radical SAM protein [Lentisphaerota bacterium]
MEKWKKIIAGSLNNSDELAEKFGLDAGTLDKINKIFPCRIPGSWLKHFTSKNDPLFRQCVPDPAELMDSKELIDDPLGEVRFKKNEVIVQKYPDRCLFLVSGECAMYCRFCTRKRKFKEPFVITQKDIDNGLQYIMEHKELRDVLISGGDPLLLDDDRLEYILQKIKSADHIKIVRIGTRVPGVLPERITAKLVKMLKKYHPLYMNIHFNHPAEFLPDTCRALKRLADAGIVLGSQTVLLKGINDDPETMRSLMWKLLENRVRPYYIFQCDLVYGTAHFRTPLSKAQEISSALRGWSSGMANAQLVIDLPGGGGKVPVTVNYLKERDGNKLCYRNYCGEEYIYTDISEDDMEKK